MTPRQFDWHLRVHGPALSAWPAPARAEALVLLRTHDDVREQLAACLETLGGDDDPDALNRMRSRLQARLAPSSAAPALRWGVRGGALAACMVAGLWAGGVLDNEPGPLASVQVAALEALQ